MTNTPNFFKPPPSRGISILASALLALLVSCTPEPEILIEADFNPSNVRKIAVADFAVRSYRPSPRMGRNVADMVVYYLYRQGFDVIPPEEVRRAAAKAEIDLTKGVLEEEARKLSREMVFDIIISGTISEEKYADGVFSKTSTTLYIQLHRGGDGKLVGLVNFVGCDNDSFSSGQFTREVVANIVDGIAGRLKGGGR